MACFPVRSNQSAPNRVEQGIRRLRHNRQSTHRPNIRNEKSACVNRSQKIMDHGPPRS
jgi:hypothetical protein